jgi:hypothetical protein
MISLSELKKSTGCRQRLEMVLGAETREVCNVRVGGAEQIEQHENIL